MKVKDFCYAPLDCLLVSFFCQEKMSLNTLLEGNKVLDLVDINPYLG